MPRSENLPLELLQTFVLLVDCGGNAAKAAELLGINQPSMSKRLRRLRAPSAKGLEHPWIFREKKHWKATSEGQQVLPAVRDLIGRYQQLRSFSGNGQHRRPQVRFACGRQTVSRFVRRAARHFWAEHRQVQLRVSTLPSQARVAGVANGSLDLAMIAQDEARIREMARCELYVETIFRDRLALVCPAKKRWARALNRLPTFRVGPAAMVGLPLLLPATDAGVRMMLDEALRRSGVLDKLEIRLEVSSWSTLLGYAADGLGVAVVSESAVPKSSKLVVRYLDPKIIPPFEAKIICRRHPALALRPDLTPEARAFYRTLKQAARRRWE